jgi:hypothetical protein
MAETFEAQPCKKCGDTSRYLSNFRCVSCQRLQSLKRGNRKNSEKMHDQLKQANATIKILQLELQQARRLMYSQNSLQPEFMQ